MTGVCLVVSAKGLAVAEIIKRSQSGKKNRQVRESLLEHLSIGWVATPIGSGGWFG